MDLILSMFLLVVNLVTSLYYLMLHSIQNKSTRQLELFNMTRNASNFIILISTIWFMFDGIMFVFDDNIQHKSSRPQLLFGFSVICSFGVFIFWLLSVYHSNPIRAAEMERTANVVNLLL